MILEPERLSELFFGKATYIIVEPKNEEEDDTQLMGRVQRCGDAAAFAALVGRYRPALIRFFRAMLAEAGQADDAAQETFLRLYLSRERYQPTGSFSAYLFQIARHYGLNQRARYAVRARAEAFTESSEDETLIILAPPTTQPEWVLLEQWERERRERAVAELPILFRLVFTLRHDGNLSYAEIAERLHIPLGTVKSRLTEATRRLRELLKEEKTNE